MMRGLIVASVAVAACGTSPVDKTAMCSLGTATGASTIEDRKVIGIAPPYAPDLGLAARESELAGSIAARRAAAWQVVERVLAPTPLGDPKLAANFGGTQPTIPLWHTWYAKDDFERTFKFLYRGLTPAQRHARTSIDPVAGFAYDARALDDIPEWPEQRYLDYLATITTPDVVDGVGGASRVGYSPGAMARMLDSYEQLHQCRLHDAPDAFAPDPMRPAVAITQTETLDVDTCGWRVLGPFQAGTGTVHVASHGDGDADLYVRRGAAPTTADFDCKSDGASSDEACELEGDGPIYVAIFAADTAHVSLDIDYLEQDVVAPTCLDAAMPRDAVIVKADWRRQLTDELLPTYDTSAPRMTQRLSGEAAWNSDGAADPTPADIYTVQLSNGQRFRMPALHVMSKELDHWLWITLWYSPDPDTDFGADRPAAVAGPWRNYKMCVTTDYLEGDADPRGGQPGSLGDALAATSRAHTPTWCSNPYLEQGHGNAGTNCIGCHQHGGTQLTAEQILERPHHGSTRERNNFFTDYSWAIQGGSGEDLSSIVKAEIDFWDASDPPAIR